jgi:hypothetical protein
MYNGQIAENQMVALVSLGIRLFVGAIGEV